MPAMGLALAHISKTFRGGVKAVRDVSLEIASGELFVILGPSGCGKTTLLRLVAGLERPSAGDVLFGGQRMTRAAPAKRNVGFVFQQPVLYPHLTVKQNLAFVLRKRRLTASEREERIERAACIFHVNTLLDRKPGQISVGEQQRTALARAVLREPSVLLMDEPLTGLDPALRAEVRREIRSAHERLKLTSIFVTHDQQEAFALADRVALMRDGAVAQVGTPEELYHHPANAFVATFIGSPGMNLVLGRVEEANGERWFTAGEAVRVPLPATCGVRAGAVVLGVRPESIQFASDERPSATLLSVDIAFVERLGDHSVAHAKLGDGQLIAIKTNRADIKPHGALRVALPHDALHFFEPGDDGKRLV